MDKSYYKLLILSIALLALASSAIYNELLAKESDEISISNSGEEIELVVHISGAVSNEGVYNIELGSRVADLIEKSAGLNEDADISNINLAEKLKDGQKIYIPSINKSEKSSASEKSIDKSYSKSKIVSSLSMEKFNVLSKSELEELPGIGPVLAKNIYDYRNKNGSFMSVDDLINVNGIGEKKLLLIKECFEKSE